MSDSHLHERRFHGGPERLRASARVALLDVGNVVQLSVQGLRINSVLDVGTGTGIFADAFFRLSLRVTGIDPNSELLTAARENVPGGEFIEAIGEELPFKDGSFDLVFLGHVLHETDDPAKALGEARRVALKRVAILEWPYRQEEHGPPLEHRLQPVRIEGLAKEAGFHSVERIELKHMDLYRLSP